MSAEEQNKKIVMDYLIKMCPAELDMYPFVTIYNLMDDIINDNWQEYSDEKPEEISAAEELGRKGEAEVMFEFAEFVLNKKAD